MDNLNVTQGKGLVMIFGSEEGIKLSSDERRQIRTFLQREADKANNNNTVAVVKILNNYQDMSVYYTDKATLVYDLSTKTIIKNRRNQWTKEDIAYLLNE